MKKVILIHPEISYHEKIAPFCREFSYQYLPDVSKFFDKYNSASFTPHDILVYEPYFNDKVNFDFIRKIKTTCPQVIVILASTMVEQIPPEAKFFSNIAGVHDKDDIAQIVEDIKNPERKVLYEVKDDKVFIFIDILRQFEKTPADLFVMLNEKKSIKLLHENNEIDTEFIDRYETKGGQFWFPAEAFPDFSILENKKYYIPVSSSVIAQQDSVDYDVYKENQGKFEKIENIKEIKENPDQDCFIRPEDTQKYRKSEDISLEKICRDKRIPIETKSKFLNSKYVKEMEEIVRTPCEENIQRLFQVGKGLEALLNSQKKSLRAIYELDSEFNTFQHSIQTAALCYKLIAECVKMSKMAKYRDVTNFYDNVIFTEDLTKQIVFISGLIHDIGKPVEVLKSHDGADYIKEIMVDIENDDRAKNLEEGQDLHPFMAYYLVKKSSSITPKIGEIILQHEEFADGSGWPEGKKEHKMSLYAKIVSLCNYYDNIIYFQKIPLKKSLLVLNSQKDKFNKHLHEGLVRVVQAELF